MGISFCPFTNTVALEDGTVITFQEWAQREKLNMFPFTKFVDESDQEPAPEAEPEKSEKEKQREFFFGKEPELSEFGKSMRAEGRCPRCGEVGRIHLSTFVCSKHGVY